MKKSLLALAAGAVLAATAVTASAQDWHDHDHDHDRDHDRAVVDHDHGHQGGWRHESWYHRGGYVPAQYRDRRYVVSDWRSYRLREPPRGYEWVRSDDGDFLLVAAATGAITDLILNSH